MINLKNICKMSLAAVVLLAVAAFPRLSYSAGSNGNSTYEDVVGEDDRIAPMETISLNQSPTPELADMNMEARKQQASYDSKVMQSRAALDKKTDKIKERADKKTTRLQNKANEKESAAINASVDADVNKEQRKEQVNEYSATRREATQAMQDASAAKAKASQEMTAALKRGDMAAAEKAKQDMAAAQSKYDSNAKKAEEAQEKSAQLVKDQKKEDKKVQRAEAKAEKAQKKAERKEIKGAEKVEKQAQKDLKKANKDLEKIQKKCDKDPANCDMTALQEAMAKQEAAAQAAADATKAREDVDGTTAAKEAAAAEEEERKRQEMLDSFGDYDEETNADEDAELAALTGGLDEKGNPVSQQRCAGANTVFEAVSCKVVTTLADLRIIIYTLSGFGLIAVAWGAIWGKISFKHLAHLCFGLFLLSMTTPFIQYFTGADMEHAMKYGNYLPAGFTYNAGSTGEVKECDESKGIICGDVNVTVEKSKWGWKDLKNSVKKGISAAKTAYNTYKTVKNTVENVSTQAQKIGTAIKNGEGGLKGIMDTMGEVATASGAIMNSAKLATNAVVNNAGSIANDIQDAGMSSGTRAAQEQNQNRITELENKLAKGGLTETEKQQVNKELEQRKSQVADNKVNQWSQGKGQNIVNKVNKVNEIGQKSTTAVRTATNAAQQGANIGGGVGTTGGDIVGSIFGAASLLGEGTGIVNDERQAKQQAAEAEQRKVEQAKAEAERKAQVQANNRDLSQGKQWDNQFNATLQEQPKSTGPVQAPQQETKENENKKEENESSSLPAPSFSETASSPAKAGGGLIMPNPELPYIDRVPLGKDDSIYKTISNDKGTGTIKTQGDEVVFTVTTKDGRSETKSYPRDKIFIGSDGNLQIQTEENTYMIIK